METIIDYTTGAFQIGVTLAQTAIRHDGGCNWIGHSTEPIDGKFQPVVRSFGADFYGGTTGIAYFLLQLYGVTKDPLIKTIAIETLVQSERLSEEEPGLSHSFFSGQIGLAHTFLWAGEILGEKEWTNKGLIIIQSIENQPITEHELDIISGVAGIIPMLLFWRKKHPKIVSKKRLNDLGDFLKNKAISTSKGTAWPTMPTASMPLTGYSHGASGIALALLELAVVLKSKKYRALAEAGFAYERNCFDEQQQNWPDFRPSPNTPSNAKPICNCMWCHGAPGIALARIRAWELTQQDIYKKEAFIALQTTCQAVLQSLRSGQVYDCSLCHGLAGNAAILLEGAKVFPAANFGKVADYAAQYISKQLLANDLPIPSGINDKKTNPSLMVGAAGTGYFLLQIANPEIVPAILLTRG